MELFWELDQNRRISSARAAGLRGEQKAEDAVDLVHRLSARVDRLTLINMALWSLLKERAGLSEEDLANRIQEIDLADGQLDGRVRAQIQTCPHCQRTLSQKHNRCLFCGYEPEEKDAFSTVAR